MRTGYGFDGVSAAGLRLNSGPGPTPQKRNLPQNRMLNFDRMGLAPRSTFKSLVY